MPENFYNRLDEILDGAREGQKRNDTVDALDALYTERQTAEVEQLRAELEEIRTTETDVTWLADGVHRIIDGVSVRTAKDPAHAQSMIAREAASLINAGILTAFVSSRVVDLSVAHIRQAEAERDRARTVAASTEKTLGEQIDRTVQAETERDAAREQAERVRALHYGVCHGACGLDDACECEERDLVCAECNDRYPCPTRRCLDGTEADR